MFQGTVGGLKVKGSIFLLSSVFLNVHLMVILVLRVNCTTGHVPHRYHAVGPTGTYLPGTTRYPGTGFTSTVLLLPGTACKARKNYVLNSRILFLSPAYWICTGPVLNHFIKNMAFSKLIFAAKNMRLKTETYATIIYEQNYTFWKKLGLNFGFWWRYGRPYMTVIRENEVVHNSFWLVLDMSQMRIGYVAKHFLTISY